MKNKTKPMMWAAALVALGTLGSVNAFAQAEAGNGGNVCDYDAGGVKTMDIELAKVLPGLKDKLSYYEDSSAASNVYGSSERDAEVNRIIEEKISKLKQFDSSVAKELIAEAKRIRATAKEITNAHWPVTSDIGPIPMIDGCTPKNAVDYVDDQTMEKKSE